MWKRLISCVLLFVFVCSCLAAQPEPLSSVTRILEIVAELEQISIERESCLRELESINEERKNELQQRIDELLQRESELKELKLRLELFGELIDDQAAYYRSLNRKLTFWRITSGILAAGLIAAIAVKAN